MNMWAKRMHDTGASRIDKLIAAMSLASTNLRRLPQIRNAFNYPPASSVSVSLGWQYKICSSPQGKRHTKVPWGLPGGRGTVPNK